MTGDRRRMRCDLRGQTLRDRGTTGSRRKNNWVLSYQKGILKTNMLVFAWAYWNLTRATLHSHKINMLYLFIPFSSTRTCTSDHFFIHSFLRKQKRTERSSGIKLKLFFSIPNYCHHRGKHAAPRRWPLLILAMYQSLAGISSLWHH